MSSTYYRTPDEPADGAVSIGTPTYQAFDKGVPA